MTISLRRIARNFCVFVVVSLIASVVVYMFRHDISYMLLAVEAPKLEGTRKTNLYPISIKTIPVVLDEGRGGGIAMLGSSLIFATRDGRFFIKDEAANEFEPMSLRLPLQLSELTSRFKRDVDIWALGLKGLGARERNGLFEVFATHHYLFEDQECYVLRLSKAVLDPSRLRGSDVVVNWTPLFDSTPCMPTTEYSFPLQSGGRMDLLQFSGELFAHSRPAISNWTGL